MADATYSQVAFNEGAPLDPSLLMKLQDNIKIAYTTAMNTSLSNKLTTYTVRTDCDKAYITGMAKTEAFVTVSVPGFTSKAIAVATCSSNVGAQEQITLEIKNVRDGAFDIYARSTVPTRNEIYVNWHIAERNI